MRYLILPIAIAAVASSNAAFAQSTSGPEEVAEQKRQQADDFHVDQAIVITAPYLKSLDVFAGTSALTGDALTEQLRGQIGDTLTGLPGVAATSFTPGASRPVLRGFQGSRINVLTDGIGAIDASNTSADHAVTIDALTAERVEVLRGPAVLLFGSQAIGGAVNVIDKRIPRNIPEEPIHIDALASYGSAAQERSVAGSIDVPLTSKLVAHVDGSYRKSNDLKVSGFVLAPNLRAEQIARVAEETAEGNLDEAAEAAELAALSGRLPNSAVETKTGGFGLAYIDDGGNLGVSVSFYDTNYGIPARPGAEHHDEPAPGGAAPVEEEEAPVTIDLKQIKVDFRGGINISDGPFESIRVRAGFADYEHIEFEGTEVGTRFLSEGIEGRLELVQRDTGNWKGATGVQFLTRNFNAIGAEAFVPKNETTQFGIFTLQEWSLGNIEIEAAGRFETVSVRAPSLSASRRFNLVSGALGFAYLSGDVKTGVNLSRASRAPTAEELFSNGPHIATQAFEIGKVDLASEKSWGAEAYLRYDSSYFDVSATVYANWFDDYIFDAATGAEQDDLPVFQYFQADARYFGFEFQASGEIANTSGFRFVADTIVDYVKADITGNTALAGPAPRIPPLRLVGGLEAQSDVLNLRAEAEWTAPQNRNAASETRTAGFTVVNASAVWKPLGAEKGFSLLFSANNIFNQAGRRAASFTKDFVPVSGRDFRITAKISL